MNIYINFLFFSTIACQTYLNFYKLLQNFNVLHLRIGINPTTALYSETKKLEKKFDEKKDYEKAKITKLSHSFKIMYTLIILKS